MGCAFIAHEAALSSDRGGEFTDNEAIVLLRRVGRGATWEVEPMDGRGVSVGVHESEGKLGSIHQLLLSMVRIITTFWYSIPYVVTEGIETDLNRRV